MSKFDKLRLKIKNKQDISYEEAEKVLLKVGFKVRSRGGSHHVFSKEGYEKTISIKKRSQLLPYQICLIEEALDSCENKNEE